MHALATNSPRIHAAVVALLVVLGLFLAPAGNARAAENDVTWTVRTASNQFGADRTSYNYTANPGSTIVDAMVVVNRGDTALELGVYAADGYTTESGQFDLVVGGAKSTAVGAWVEGKTDHITVAPGETLEVPFTLSVPDDATPGDYAGGIVTSLGQPDEKEGINVDRRLGIRIALRVSGEIAPGLAIENMRVDWNAGLNPFAGGDATVSYTIHNTGNAALSAGQAAGVTGPFGWLPTEAGEIDAPPLLLPGESWNVTVPVRDVAATVLLSATATVTPVVKDASGSTTNLGPITASANGWAVPWMLLLLVVALAALVVGALRVLKSRRARQQAREDERVKQAVERALEDIEAPTPAG
jgi:hypothetical protein